jgi:hypothetical protein
MSCAYYVVLERPIDGLETFMNGKRLAKQIELLDTAAERLGVRSLSAFVSIPPEEIAELLEDTTDLKMRPVEQYSAQDGLATVRALLAHPEAQSAVDDLKDCERILAVAAEHGVGWHFQIDI